MPKVVVEGPDGRKFAFPDTMPRAEINAFMKQKYGTKARDESVQDYLARFGREQAATEARAKDIDREATAVGRAEGERAAERMGVDNPFLMAFAAPAIGLAQQEGGRQVFNREGTVLADEAAGLAAANSAGFFVPGLVNPQFGARVEEGRRQQPLAAFAGDIAGGYGPGEIIGAGVAKAAQAIGPGMAAVGRMFSRGPGPNATNAIAGGTLGGIAPAETAEERARNIAVGVGLGAVARPASQMVDDLTRTGAPRAMPDAMPAGAGDNPYFGRQSMRPPGSGPSAREIETQQQWATATPIVTQARTTALSAQQAADAALQSKAPADIARAKAEKKTLVGQLQEAQASRAGMDTPEDARLAETLASLTENTSDPVLLSTQISAAKTSLDRLLTDIGSPVEGNLIPVKTNILTRTQAPRSAAEGPQGRASVTRYAEGSDEIKPQGFGAGGSKGPEQSAYGEQAVEHFGLTNSIDEAGYMLPDGRMLDLSGRHDMLEGDYIRQGTKNVATGRDWQVGQRNTDHRELPFSVVSGDTTANMLAFQKEAGAIRIMPGTGISVVSVPERSQIEKLVRAWKRRYGNEPMLVDVDDLNGRNISSVEVENVTVDSVLKAFGATPPPIKGMGFGAGTPKTPQQAVRFETPGSPEYEAAVAKGLDMSQAGRMGRAKEMGFDTDTVLYHGTPDSRGIMETGFKTVKEKFGVKDPDRVYFFAENKKVADTYADDRRAFDYQNATAETIPVYLKSRNPKIVDWGGRPFRGKEKDGSGFSIRDYIDQARADGHDSVIIRNVIDTYDGKGKPSTIRAVFDPSNIRSINAAFDPEKSGSSTLLAAAPFAAVGGAGLTSERELGSKMKREKKD
jgi:hypothetical protein